MVEVNQRQREYRVDEINAHVRKEEEEAHGIQQKCAVRAGKGDANGDGDGDGDGNGVSVGPVDSIRMLLAQPSDAYRPYKIIK
jgi:hypothetical protein